MGPGDAMSGEGAYGLPPPPQPLGSPTTAGARAGGAPEPMARTTERPAQAGPQANPVVVLVVLLGLAFVVLAVLVG